MLSLNILNQINLPITHLIADAEFSDKTRILEAFFVECDNI